MDDETNKFSSGVYVPDNADNRQKDNRQKDNRLKDNRLKDNRQKHNRQKENLQKDNRLKDNRLKDNRQKNSRQKETWERPRSGGVRIPADMMVSSLYFMHWTLQFNWMALFPLQTFEYSYRP